MIPQEHKSGLILLTGNIENILQVLFYFFFFWETGRASQTFDWFRIQLGQWFSTKSDFSSQGTVGDVWRVWVVNLGCYWRLLGSDQGCC